MTRLLRTACALAAATACATAALAQTNRGAITGTVFDPSGAVLPGATVTIVNAGTNQEQRVATSTTGTFSSSNLEPVV